MAKTLLSQSTVKVTDIAGKVGYYNYLPFYENVQKCTGITPQEFRKQSRTCNQAQHAALLFVLYGTKVII